MWSNRLGGVCKKLGFVVHLLSFCGGKKKKNYLNLGGSHKNWRSTPSPAIDQNHSDKISWGHEVKKRHDHVPATWLRRRSVSPASMQLMSSDVVVAFPRQKALDLIGHSYRWSNHYREAGSNRKLAAPYKCTCFSFLLTMLGCSSVHLIFSSQVIWGFGLKKKMSFESRSRGDWHLVWSFPPWISIKQAKFMV